MSLQKQVLCFVYILKLINRSLSALVKVWNPLALQRRMTENERSGLVFSSLGLKLYGEENGRFSCLPPQVPLGSSPLTSVQGSRRPGSSPRSSQKIRSGLGNGNAAEGHRKGIESWGESPRTPLSLPSALPGGKSNDVPGDEGRPEWRETDSFLLKNLFSCQLCCQKWSPRTTRDCLNVANKKSQFPDRVCGYKKCLWDKHSWLFHSLLPVGNGGPRAVWRAGCVQGMSWVLISGWHL